MSLLTRGILQRLRAPGPKRVLALDGGGIRGAVTLGYLRRIETILRQRHSQPDLVLADYFDLIGGTSTGSIIAAGLATGMSAQAIADIYLEFGGEVFTNPSRLWFIRGQFDPERLRSKLRQFFGETCLGGEELRTGLCVVAKRYDTNSVWLFHNHPEGKFYPVNKDLLLRQVVRASTAAPTYFEPEPLTFTNRAGTEIMTREFVDGGVSMHVNPALQLFLLATLSGYPFQWQTGEENLLIVSVGTGYWQVSQASGN